MLRGTTGTWNSAVLLDAGVVLIGFVLPLFIREAKTTSAQEQSSEVQES